METKPRFWGEYVLWIAAAFVLFFVVDANAQCAMCRASVESNVTNGEATFGNGLNTGILYLMSVPYIMGAIIGFLWYKSSKKPKTDKRFMTNLPPKR